MNEKKESIAFIPINKLKNKHFLVKEYQRGYKWESEQILALLKDILNHKSGKYCLQPIIVDEKSDGIELIDGQQRITTLFLILHFLGEEKYFTIDYQTRKASQSFISSKLFEMNNAVKENKDWENFISTCSDIENLNYNNVDVYHFYLVYSEILKWFSKKTVEFKEDFRLKILNNVYIIWYDIKNNNKSLIAEDVFLNLNVGKIPLTNSELIKALFILDVQKNYSKELAVLKSTELATEWDLIENQLHEPDFWYFICDNDYYNSIDTRIDLIIDITRLIIPSKDWDGMEAYRFYEEQYLENKPLNWEHIKQTFNKLNEWYRDKELYHYVGFLIVTRLKRLSDIIKMSKGSPKQVFKKDLIEIIKTELKRTRTEDNKVKAIYDVDSINYEDNRKECQYLLLLLNVQYFLNNSSNNKFPFDLYKNENWSVEHINPQNPKDFKNINQIIKWLNSFKNYYEKYKQNDIEIIVEINYFLGILNFVDDKNRKLSSLKLSKADNEKFQNIIDKITNDLELHGIGNLALLDSKTNSKLGNNIFIDKRKVVLELYYLTKEKGVFIPECTKDVFTKNFSKENQNISDEFFSIKDMSDYKSHLYSQLKKFYI